MGQRNIRVDQEYERLLRLTAWMRECLEAQMTASLGTAGKHGVDAATLRQWETLVKAFDSLAATKIRLDKSVREGQKTMTPERELEVVRSFLRSMPHDKRGRFLDEESAFHAQNEGTT